MEQLREWKVRAERAAAVEIAAGSEFRPIAAGEVRQELTVGELAAFRALSEAFGCHVETNVHVAAEGWLRLHAALSSTTGCSGWAGERGGLKVVGTLAGTWSFARPPLHPSR